MTYISIYVHYVYTCINFTIITLYLMSKSFLFALDWLGEISSSKPCKLLYLLIAVEI